MYLKHTLTLFFLLFSAMLFGQGGKPKTPPQKNPDPLEVHKKIYKESITNGDGNVALNSLYYIIAVEGKNCTYRDTLALLYFNMGSYALCEQVANAIVRDFKDSVEKGQRLAVLEALALSQGSLGKVKEAIASFEMLLAKTNEMYHAYRLAELQYNYKRIGEAMQTILKAETMPNNLPAGVISLDIGDNRKQNVKLEAAVENLKGYILLAEYPDQKPAAILAFKKALELQPDFVLAKNNLDYAEKGAPAPGGEK